MQIKNGLDRQRIITLTHKLGDIRFSGQLVFVVIVLLISWSGVKSIQANYELQKQITAMKQQNSLQALENNNLSLQNSYYNTNQYLELSARQNFGLAAPGEQEIIVPKNVALSYTVNLPSDKTGNQVAQPPAFQQNVESWVKFFLHRQSQ